MPKMAWYSGCPPREHSEPLPVNTGEKEFPFPTFAYNHSPTSQGKGSVIYCYIHFFSMIPTHRGLKNLLFLKNLHIYQEMFANLTFCLDSRW